MINILISWLITWQSDWLIPLPSDSLGNKVRELGHVKDHADGRGSGHEDGEDGFLGGPWDEAVHQVRTRPLVTLHQPRHLETIVYHVEGIPGVETDTCCMETGGLVWIVTTHSSVVDRSHMKPPSNSSLNSRLHAYVHQRAPAIGSLRFFRVSSSSSWPLLPRKPALPEPCHTGRQKTHEAWRHKARFKMTDNMKQDKSKDGITSHHMT